MAIVKEFGTLRLRRCTHIVFGFCQFVPFGFHSIPICLGEVGNAGSSVDKAATGRSVDTDFHCWQEIDRLGSGRFRAEWLSCFFNSRN
ncbi:hypothetical protein L596_025799 [Steinernema carpocapsae]|uniref:Uncharacterized protein n=1 Tax=Steinernema carpocapsae TaxID=34508 RepID=A0A4U5M8T7_STECR|nr:hypothetical protein L596_025799 [Steinernema carpocapsae]